MQKYIVFDFDGTLVDSQNIFVPIYNQLAEKHGYKAVKEDEIEHLRKLTMPERCKQLNVPLYKLPILALEFYKLYQPAIKNLVLFHGMKEVLDELHKKRLRNCSHIIELRRAYSGVFTQEWYRKYSRSVLF